MVGGEHEGTAGPASHLQPEPPGRFEAPMVDNPATPCLGSTHCSTSASARMPRSRRAARCSPASRPGCGATGRLAAAGGGDVVTPVWRSTLLRATSNALRVAGGWESRRVTPAPTARTTACRRRRSPRHILAEIRALAGLSATEPPPHAAPVSADREERGQQKRRDERQRRDRGVPETEAHGDVGHLHAVDHREQPAPRLLPPCRPRPPRPGCGPTSRGPRW